MELKRPAAQVTSIAFPMADTSGNALSGLGNLTAKWIAWADTAPPKTGNGNPGFQAMANTFSEIAATSIYQGTVAAAELPAASPYVMLQFVGTGAATQYILIKTSSQYANVTGINGTNIVAPVTAGYMPVDVKQTIALAAPADNSIEKSLARTYFATGYIDATISSRSAPATAQTIDQTVALNLTTPTDNSIGKSLSRMYFATQYLDAAVSTRSAPATAQTIDQTAALNLTAPTDNSIGKALSRMYFATDYITGASAYADAFLGRNLAKGSSGGRTVTQALMALRNRINIAAGTLSVYNTDDTAVEWTAVVATQAVTAIITDVDPP